MLKPTALSPLKKPPVTPTVVPPALTGVVNPLAAIATATPRRASVWLALTSDCRKLTPCCSAVTLAFRLAIVCGPKFVAARLPVASVVTNGVGPDCAAKLAPDALPGTRQGLEAVPDRLCLAL